MTEIRANGFDDKGHVVATKKHLGLKKTEVGLSKWQIGLKSEILALTILAFPSTTDSRVASSIGGSPSAS
jgi:hypothetical protein